MYIIIDKKSGVAVQSFPSLKRRAVMDNEVPHTERGEVFMTDVLAAMGYDVSQAIKAGTVTRPSRGPMIKARTYNLDDLTMIHVDQDGHIR